MKTYTLSFTFFDGNYFDVDVKSENKKKAKEQIYNSLTDAQKDALESIECIDEVEDERKVF